MSAGLPLALRCPPQHGVGQPAPTHPGWLRTPAPWGPPRPAALGDHGVTDTCTAHACRSGRVVSLRLGPVFDSVSDILVHLGTGGWDPAGQTASEVRTTAPSKLSEVRQADLETISTMCALDAYPDLIAAKVDKELISTGRAGCRPGGITVGLYNTPGKPGVSLATPKPSGVEREWAASAGHYVPEPPPVKVLRKSLPQSWHVSHNSWLRTFRTCTDGPPGPALLRLDEVLWQHRCWPPIEVRGDSESQRQVSARVFGRKPKPFVDEYGAAPLLCVPFLGIRAGLWRQFLFTSSSTCSRLVYFWFRTSAHASNTHAPSARRR